MFMMSQSAVRRLQKLHWSPFLFPFAVSLNADRAGPMSKCIIRHFELSPRNPKLVRVACWTRPSRIQQTAYGNGNGNQPGTSSLCTTDSLTTDVQVVIKHVPCSASDSDYWQIGGGGGGQKGHMPHPPPPPPSKLHLTLSFLCICKWFPPPAT